MYIGILSKEKSSPARLNITVFPRRKYEREVAVTEEIKRGTIELKVISIISTSNVNTTPAIGA
jgi:hypothetical protein